MKSKKILLITIFSFLFLGFSQAVSAAGFIDQQQTNYLGGSEEIYYPGHYWAQSFVPTKSTLSQVDLALAKKTSMPYGNFYVEIRTDLNNQPYDTIASVSRSAANLPTSMSWVRFNMPYTKLTPGKKYWIFVRYTDGLQSDAIKWGRAASNLYSNGNGYDFYNDQYKSWDFAFKTYGGVSIQKIIPTPKP